MKREGVVHRGIILRFAGKSYRIHLSDLTGGEATTRDAHREVLEHLGRRGSPREVI